MLSKKSSSQPFPVPDTDQGDNCKSVRMGRLLTRLLHTVAQESCAGCERGPGGAGAQNWVNTFAGNAIVHFHLFQLPECLLFVPTKQAVAQAEERKADALKQQEILLEEAKLQGAKEMHQAVENAVAESQEAIQKILKEAEEACSQIREQAAQRKEEAVLAVIGKVVGEYGSC